MKNVYFVGAPTQDRGIEEFAYISSSCKSAKFYWFTYKISDEIIRKYKTINFIRGLDDKTLRSYIKDNMDIFISCSHAEGFCLPIAEAMLLEKPVLSYALEEVQSVYSDLIEYVTCFDRNEFIKKLLPLINANNQSRIKKYAKAKMYIQDNYLPDIVSSKLLAYIIK